MRSPTLLLLFLLCGLCACSGDELVGVHVDLAKDGSGTVTLRALRAPEEVPPAEARSEGAKWNLRASLVASQGTFEKVADLKIGDGGITFTPDLTGERPGLRVRLQRGPETPWIQALTPDAEARQKMAKACDPTGRTREIADVLRIEVDAPGSIITSGVLPTGRGVAADRDGERAVLLLPVRTALEAGDEFVWEISWLMPK